MEPNGFVLQDNERIMLLHEFMVAPAFPFYVEEDML